MEMTRERISFTFDPRDMLLSLQMDFSFVRAAVACAILERTSGLELSSETTAPRYLKLVYSAQFLSFYLYLSLDAIGTVCHQFGLLRTDLHLIPCAGFVERASMSSANRRLVIFLPPMLTFPSCSSRASDIIRSRKMLKRVGDRRHPCLTPTVVLNHSPMLPFIWTALLALSVNLDWINNQACRLSHNIYIIINLFITNNYLFELIRKSFLPIIFLNLYTKSP